MRTHPVHPSGYGPDMLQTPQALQNLWFKLSRATLEKSTFFSYPQRAESLMHRTHLKLAEYATETESVIKPTMKGVPSNS